MENLLKENFVKVIPFTQSKFDQSFYLKLKKSNKTGHAYSQIVYSNSRQVSSNKNRTKQITSSSQLSFCPLSGVIYMINGNHLREQK
jgi:hypothetical protein